MSKTITIRNLVLGEGRPAICVPIVGATLEEITGSAERVKNSGADLAELRGDFFQGCKDPVLLQEMVLRVKKICGELPILFTFRTKAEGGETEATPEEYEQINREVLGMGLVDLIDVEFFSHPQQREVLLPLAKTYGVYTVASNHDFQATPSEEEIVKRLCAMQDGGADIAKIAVMPVCRKDVLTLMRASAVMAEEKARVPIITMSMSGTGAVSRFASVLTGSCLTFGTAGAASAPGQIPVEDLKYLLDLTAKVSGIE